MVAMFQAERLCMGCNKPMRCTPVKKPPPVLLLHMEHNHHHPREAALDLQKVLASLQEVRPSFFH